MTDAYEQYKQRMYQEGLEKNLQVGDMVQVDAYYVSDSGIGKVVERIDDNGILKVKVLRIMKNDYTLIKKPKVFTAEVIKTVKIDVDTLMNNLMAELNDIRAQFLAYK